LSKKQRLLTFVPPPLPDQTLFSWIWMYHRMSGNAFISYSAQQALGQPAGNSISTYPHTWITFAWLRKASGTLQNRSSWITP